MPRNPAKDANDKAEREMHEAVDKVIDDKKKEEIGTKKAEKEVAADLNEAAHKDTQKRSRPSKRMPTKRPGKSGTTAPQRSRKGAADIGAKDSWARREPDRQRQRQKDATARPWWPAGQEGQGLPRKF